MIRVVTFTPVEPSRRCVTPGRRVSHTGLAGFLNRLDVGDVFQIPGTATLPRPVAHARRRSLISQAARLGIRVHTWTLPKLGIWAGRFE